MDVEKLISTLSLTGADIPPRSTTRPVGKPKFVKFLSGDNGEGMPETFFEGERFNSNVDEQSFEYATFPRSSHIQADTGTSWADSNLGYISGMCVAYQPQAPESITLTCTVSRR
jgi:hypothetical protein